MNQNQNDLPKITVKGLRDSLALLGPAYDNHEVFAWLPGTYVQLGSTMIPRHGKLLIESNIAETWQAAGSGMGPEQRRFMDALIALSAEKKS